MTTWPRLVDAVAPVIADLREDPVTAGLIDEITAIRDALPPITDDPVTCDATTFDTTPTASSGDVAALNGVYQYQRHRRCIPRGRSHGLLPHWRQSRHVHVDAARRDGPLRTRSPTICSRMAATSASKTGRTPWMATRSPSSDPLFPPGERFRYTQDAAGNLQLEAVQTDDVIVTVVLTGATWIRIGDGPS